MSAISLVASKNIESSLFPIESYKNSIIISNNSSPDKKSLINEI